MKIEVVEMNNLDGGGAELVLDLDDEAKRFLINEGFISALEKGLARVEALHEQEIKDDTDNT